MTPLAQLGDAVKRLERLRESIPEAHRPPAEEVFRDLEDARAEVAQLSRNGHALEADAIVANFEENTGAQLAMKLAHSPLEDWGV